MILQTNSGVGKLKRIGTVFHESVSIARLCVRYFPFKRTMAPLKSRQTFFNARFFSCINYVHDVVQKANFVAILSDFTAQIGFCETPQGFLIIWTVAERASSLNIKRQEILTLQASLSMQIPLLCAVTAPVWELRWIFNYVWLKQTVTRTFLRAGDYRK